jgi:hypothetical protein
MTLGLLKLGLLGGHQQFYLKSYDRDSGKRVSVIRVSGNRAHISSKPGQSWTGGEPHHNNNNLKIVYCQVFCFIFRSMFQYLQ